MDLLQYLYGNPERQKESENDKNKMTKYRKMIEIFHVDDIIETAKLFRCIEMVIMKAKVPFIEQSRINIQRIQIISGLRINRQRGISMPSEKNWQPDPEKTSSRVNLNH